MSLTINICWREMKDNLYQQQLIIFCSGITPFPITQSKHTRSTADGYATHQIHNWVMRPDARHTLKPLEAAIWAAVQPSLSAWLMRSAGTTGLDVPGGLSPPFMVNKPDLGSSALKEFPWAGTLWYIRSLRLSTLPVSTAAWIGVQPSWK